MGLYDGSMDLASPACCSSLQDTLGKLYRIATVHSRARRVCALAQSRIRKSLIKRKHVSDQVIHLLIGQDIGKGCWHHALGKAVNHIRVGFHDGLV